jgi:hypothetical protein
MEKAVNYPYPALPQVLSAVTVLVDHVTGRNKADLHCLLNAVWTVIGYGLDNVTTHPTPVGSFEAAPLGSLLETLQTNLEHQVNAQTPVVAAIAFPWKTLIESLYKLALELLSDK